MQRPPTITWRNVDHGPTAEADVQKYVAQLDKVHPRITGVDVVVEQPHGRHQQGNLYHVRVDIHLPGDQIVVKRDPPAHQAREDLHVAIRDAFKAARKRLNEQAAVVRGEVKPHEELPVGTVAQLSDEAGGYGFIRTPDGREIYFHHNALQDEDWADLEVGDVVHFEEGLGEKGAQATVVLAG